MEKINNKHYWYLTLWESLGENYFLASTLVREEHIHQPQPRASSWRLCHYCGPQCLTSIPLWTCCLCPSEKLCLYYNHSMKSQFDEILDKILLDMEDTEDGPTFCLVATGPQSKNPYECIVHISYLYLLMNL